MSLLGQVLLALVVISLFCSYLALRLRDWRYGMLAALLALPIGVIAQDPYDLLLVLPTLQLVIAIGLRWHVSPVGWLDLGMLGAAAWLIGAAGPYLWHWPLWLGFSYLVAFCIGLGALIWRRPPWTGISPGALHGSS